MKTLPALALAGLASLFCVTSWADDDAEKAPATNVSALVKTQPLSQHLLSQTVTAYGTVSGQPAHTFTINLPAAGRVDALLVGPGQAVKKGQPLLRVSADPAARLSYTQAETAVAFAKRDLVRQQTLLGQQLATHAQVDAAQHSLHDAEQALAAQRALGTAQAETTLSAPVAGVVGTLSVAPGDRFAAGAALAQLSESTAMQVRLGLLPEDSRRVLPGMKVQLSAVFDGAQTAEGVIDVVSHQIDPASQRVDAIVRLNADWLPGTRVQGRITLSARKTLAVPRQAVLRDEQGAYVFQVSSGQAHRVAVSAGEESSGLVAVSGALQASAPVVVLGNYELEDGMHVREGGP